MEQHQDTGSPVESSLVTFLKEIISSINKNRVTSEKRYKSDENKMFYFRDIREKKLPKATSDFLSSVKC